MVNWFGKQLNRIFFKKRNACFDLGFVCNLQAWTELSGLIQRDRDLCDDVSNFFKNQEKFEKIHYGIKKKFDIQ